MKEPDDPLGDKQRQSRRFAVSANRGRARHQVRYVESGGGNPDSDCRVCAPMITPGGPETGTTPTDSEPMWDTRYKTEQYLYGTAPNDFLAGQYHCLPENGRVLCLADGEGRNSVFLAGLGFDVTAVDQSAVGLEKADRLAREQDVSITLVQADLADWPLGSQQWDAIVAIFCHLPPTIRSHVHSQIPAALKPGGVLLLEAYTPAQLSLGTGGPPDVDLMQSADILEAELSSLNFRHLLETERDVFEGSGHTGRGAVVQVIAQCSP
ncbi:MAG: class I SAM-dependent methyltransferase [Pseudohongiellaceae bacterium]